MPITIDRITYTFKKGTPWERTALTEVSFSLERGEILGISGPTGSGKSTLLMLIAGLLPLQTGQMLVDGQSCRERVSAQRSSRIAMAAQMPEKQLFELTVYKDIAFGPANLGVKKEELPFRVEEAMQAVGLDYNLFKDRAPYSLSTGEKRRAAIAGILAMHPDYLLLDEPGAGLDWEGREELGRRLMELRSQGKGIMVVSHHLDDLLRICDRLLILEKGSVKYWGETLDVVEKIENDLCSQGLTPVREIANGLENRGWQINTRVRSSAAVAAEIIKNREGTEKHDQ